MQPRARTKLLGLMYPALAGLETGVVGGTLVLGWWALSSLAARQPVWTIPERLGAHFFYHGVVFRNELVMAVVAGVALQVASAGTLGSMFGLAVRGSWSLQRVVLLGLGIGLFWHYAGYEVFMRTAYAIPPRRTMLAGHLLFGLCLGMYRHFLQPLQSGQQART
jgi:hypothetical protein